jgi:hypothetical protein
VAAVFHHHDGLRCIGPASASANRVPSYRRGEHPPSPTPDVMLGS